MINTAIDYLLVSEEHESYVKNMTIDIDKETTPFRDDSLPGRKVYTDHNMITMNMDLHIKKVKSCAKTSRKLIDKFKKETENSNMKEIWENDKHNWRGH